MATSLESRLIKKTPFVLRDRNPTVDDIHFLPPYIWLNRVTDQTYLLVDVTVGVATWKQISDMATATANITYYVATDGNDTLGDGTTENPFATRQHAIDLLPKIMGGYTAEILIKDGTYPEGTTTIENFIDGSIYIYGENWDVDTVLLNIPDDKFTGLWVKNNSAFVYLSAMSVRVHKNNAACIAVSNCSHIDIEDVKVGDNGNTGTVGINTGGGMTLIGSVVDIDADKVATGIKSPGISLLYDGTSCGDIKTDAPDGGIISDGVHLVNDFLKIPASPSILSGGLLSAGTDAGTFKVAELVAQLRLTDDDDAEFIKVSLTEQDNQVITSPNITYYVILNLSGPSISISTSEGNETQNLTLGRVMKDSGNAVHYLSGGHRFQHGIAKLHERAHALRYIELESGSVIAYSGLNNFTMTEGVAYSGINALPLSSYDSVITKFFPVYQDGGVGWTTGAERNVIDFAHYDDGTGVLGNIGVGRYGCHWVYKHASMEHVFVVYGRDSYKLAEAETAPEPTRPAYITDFGLLIGCIIAPQAGGSFITVQMVTDTFFTGTSVSDHKQLGNLDYDNAGHTGFASLQEALTWGTL